MILSISHNFIFVHVPKTAGSSLHTALAPYGRNRARSLWRSFSRRLPVKESPQKAHFRIHAPASEIRAKLSPKVFGQFLSFAVVRNPFDHAVSHYEYMKQYRSSRIAQRFEDMNFLDYLTYRLAPRRPWDRIFARLPDQSYFLVDSFDHLLVDRVLHFETLAAEFEDLSNELGLPIKELPKVNRTQARTTRRPIRSYYDAGSEDLVRRLYARDFELFGYE